MGVFDWIGDVASLGPKDNKFAKYFTGSWSVTIGTAIQGNYGTTLQSYFGPYITHVVDTSLGVGFLVGKYVNELAVGWPFPEGTFSQFGGNVVGSLFTGIGGYVTWVYGPNITVNYGGPVGTITRAKSFTKTAYTADAQGIPLGLIGKGTDLKPAGAAPKGIDAETMASGDKKILEAINLLSAVLNYTIAILELTVKFAYSSFTTSETTDPNTNEIIEQPNPSEDNYPLGKIDFILGQLPPRIMAFIYSIDTVGSFEFWGTANANKVKAFMKKITDFLHISPGPKSWLAYSQATANECLQSSVDSIEALVVVVAALAVILGILALVL
jgi:hypothetical protein